MMNDRIIGIDPDIDKSGVCYLNRWTREVEVASMDLPELIDYLADNSQDIGLVVVVEAGWKNAISNYHRGTYGRVAQKVALNVGRNQQVGLDIVKMCKHFGLEVVEKTPLRKIWKGKDRKITHNELSQFVPNLKKKTNQEERDAVLLAWDYAGLPIMIKPNKSSK